VERLKETSQTADIASDVVAEILTKNIPHTILERNRHANLFGVTDVDENDDDGNRTTINPTSTHNNDNIYLIFYFKNTLPLC
jgi:hypothetical protein